MNNQKLNKYIGWRWSNITKNTIESEFKSYNVISCDMSYFNSEVNLGNTIRCLIMDNIITHIKMN